MPGKAGRVPVNAPKPHEWMIEEREYRRQEERRGRRYAYAKVDPRKTALVVIDMIPFFIGESGYSRGIVPNVNALARSLREAGGTVAWIVPGYPERSLVTEEFLGPEVAEMYARSGGEGPVPDRVWPGMETDPGDLFAEKTQRDPVHGLPDVRGRPPHVRRAAAHPGTGVIAEARRRR